MHRFHVHVAVDDLARNIEFYKVLFAAEPSVVQDDYAKWQLEDPRVNFAISARGAEAGLEHLGIQVDSADELAAVESRLARAEGPVVEQTGTACCYARSDKYWIQDPRGIAWETFHTLDAELTFSDPGQACATPSDNACAPAEPVGGACCPSADG